MLAFLGARGTVACVSIEGCSAGSAIAWNATSRKSRCAMIWLPLTNTSDAQAILGAVWFPLAVRRGLMQRIVAQNVKESQGERVDDVRTSSDEAWGVFLREFKRWCASDDARTLLTKTPQRVILPGPW